MTFLILSLCLPISDPPEAKAKLVAAAFQAAREGAIKTLEDYLATNPDINEPNGRGDTLLIVAAYNGQAKAVGLLLKQKGIAVDAKNKMGLTALTGAAFKGHVEIAKQLIESKAAVDFANDKGQTALMFAVQAGKTKMVETLLAAGADVNRKDKDGKTALDLAKATGTVEIVKLLEAAVKK